MLGSLLQWKFRFTPSFFAKAAWAGLIGFFPINSRVCNHLGCYVHASLIHPSRVVGMGSQLLMMQMLSGVGSPLLNILRAPCLFDVYLAQLRRFLKVAI